MGETMAALLSRNINKDVGTIDKFWVVAAVINDYEKFL